MDLDEKILAKGIHSLSSSVQSTPEKIIHLDDASRSTDLLQEFIKSSIKKDLLQNLEKNTSASSKSKMKELLKGSNKTMKKQELRKTNDSPVNPPSSKKQSRKGENPVRLPPASKQASDFGSSRSWICKNLACKAVLSMQDSFCRRCSCCICRTYDDNKDPSLWFVCSSESGDEDCCGSSCHIACALKIGKTGVVNLGQLMQLDGSYCCASCGKVSGILSTWKKQLVIAKDARRVDVLCHRIYLSYSLLQGTSRFKELYEIVEDAKTKLETEVGPIDNASDSMVRGIVSRLSMASEVQKLCSVAIQKVEELSSRLSNGNSLLRVTGDTLPLACTFFFEELTSTKISIVLIELPSASSNNILGYKLWYFKSGEEAVREDPYRMLARNERRISISDLQPCTGYTIRIISFNKEGIHGHSEAKCFTKSVEVIRKNDSAAEERFNKALVEGISTWANSMSKPASEPSAMFKVRELGKVLHTPGAQERGLSESFCSADIEKCCGMGKTVEPIALVDQVPSLAGQLDLNLVASVPDLNEEFTMPFEFSRDEENGCTVVRAVETCDDATLHNVEKNSIAKVCKNDDLQNCVVGAAVKVVPALESHARACQKRALCPHEETHDCDSTLVIGSPHDASNGIGCLDEKFEYCVKIIRWLECGNHINREFRMKFLTWFSLRSKEQERRVVNTFIHTMLDDPSSLGGQLVDSFSDIISIKRPRNGLLR